MNVTSSTTSQLFQNTSTTAKSSSLSSDQQDLIKSVLSKYDTSSLSSSDATEIVKAFQEACIEPSDSLASTMKASGFDAQEIGNLANAGKGDSGRPSGPPPPPPQKEVDSVSSLLESLLSTDEEDDSTTSTATDTSNSTLSSSSSSFDAILDYTTKIMSLKDDAKTDVKNLLEKYNSNDNTLSQEDTQKFIVNSLSQILGESDNYNTMSFYA